MSFLLQADTTATAAQQMLEDVPVEKTISIWELMTSGGIGGQAIMLAIGLMLFFAIYVYFERLMAINAASKIDVGFMNRIRETILSGKIDQAKMLCAQSTSPVARLIEKGISRIGKPLEDIDAAIENAG